MITLDRNGINREAAKIWSLSSGEIDKYEYLTGEEMLPFNPSEMIEQAKFTNSLLAKALGKQTKKQCDALRSFSLSNKADVIKQIESIFPQNQLNDLIINNLKEIKKITK